MKAVSPVQNNSNRNSPSKWTDCYVGVTFLCRALYISDGDAVVERGFS